MSSAVISRQTSDALDRVLAFFGIDSYNRPLFGEAARMAGVDAFSKTIEGLDAAIRVDSRAGTERRIRERIALQREIDQKNTKALEKTR